MLKFGRTRKHNAPESRLGVLAVSSRAFGYGVGSSIHHLILDGPDVPGPGMTHDADSAINRRSVTDDDDASLIR